MSHWLAWYLVSSILGWLAFPVGYRLLPGLKDRGFTTSRTMGWLIWGYSFWLLASLGILPFNIGGLLFCAAILISLSLWALSGNHWREIIGWLRSQKRLIFASETIFLIAFAGWAVVRAANPEAIGTEKPMELSFINAILRSQTFPPHDPWLSGYAISYYYFGYVLTAIMAKITATSGGVAFNLGISLIFALSASGAYGLIYNLLNALNLRSRDGPNGSRPTFTFASMLGPVYVLFVSNLEGFLQVLHTRGLFWFRSPDGSLSSPFWRWLDIQDLSSPPQEPFSWIPTRFWWWWRASRVLQDYDLRGASKEIIDEFPFFSYLLADLHPHVLAMPFAFLAITLALNLFLFPQKNTPFQMQFRLKPTWVKTIVILPIAAGLIATALGTLYAKASLAGFGMAVLALSAVLIWQLFRSEAENGDHDENNGELELAFGLEIDPVFFVLAAIVLGGMAFLNTWDFPVYVFIFAAAYMLTKIVYRGEGFWRALGSLFGMGAALGISGVIFYLPFYLGFSSQAGGLLPNLIYPTRGIHLWVMFVPLLFPIGAFLIYRIFQRRNFAQTFRGIGLAAGIMLALWLLSIGFGWGISFIPDRGQLFLSTLGAENTGELIRAAFVRRLIFPGAWITLLLLLGIIIGMIPQFQRIRFHIWAGAADEAVVVDRQSNASLNIPEVFNILLILTGLLLVLTPEFFYLLDMFGWRINTIFKFYFQAWLIWSIAAAFSSVILLLRLKGFWAIAFRVILIVLFFTCLTYPALSLWSKTDGFHPAEWTLDSTAYFAHQSPDEMAAIDWLKSAPYGVVAEAVPAAGGSYTEYARVSMLSGLPAVLGWVGHENQWRGDNQLLAPRQTDLQRLYCSRDWEETLQILNQYKIRYVFVGNLERITYRPDNGLCPVGLVETKFNRNMNEVFQQGPIVIYEYLNPRNDANTTTQP